RSTRLRAGGPSSGEARGEGFTKILATEILAEHSGSDVGGDGSDSPPHAGSSAASQRLLRTPRGHHSAPVFGFSHSAQRLAPAPHPDAMDHALQSRPPP